MKKNEEIAQDGGCLLCLQAAKMEMLMIAEIKEICDPSHQNRAVVGRMHFKILLHLYGKKQRKQKKIKTYIWP